MSNGDYGDINWYRSRKDEFDQVVLVDGGANQASRIGVVPRWVVGDMDSIIPEAWDYAAGLETEFVAVPCEKDETDTQLALDLVAREGASEVVIWGGIGSRIDHTLSNLFNAASLIAQGIMVRFESPEETIYIIDDFLQLPGNAGETVSLIAMGEDVQGVTLQGFKYPLTRETLFCHRQYGVANIITSPDPTIDIESGIVAVIHYQSLKD